MLIPSMPSMRLAVSLVVLLLLCTGCSGESRTYLFRPVAVDFVRQWDHVTHPFTGGAVIDVDGDGVYEVFAGGSEGQADVLLTYDQAKNSLIDVQKGTGLSPLPKSATYGVTAADMDNDGRVDVIVARNNGVYLYLNQGSRHFEERKIDFKAPLNSVPFHVSVADIDHDGLLDLYISNFVDFKHFKSATFNDPNHAKHNVLLHNKGNIQFEDITVLSGTQGSANTFDAVFVDLDSDGWQDLVVAHNTGPVEVFKNKHDLTFERYVPFAPFGFWMGIGVGDIDNDGDQDLFFPNVGTSIPKILTKGDLHDDQQLTLDWLLLRNDGDFHFANVTHQYSLGKKGFGWGGVFDDLNLDGKLELLVAQNYIKWPPHKWFRLSTENLVQGLKDGNPYYYHQPSLGLETKEYSQSSLIVDMNHDGKPDYVWVNMQGPLQAYINTTSNHFITFELPQNAKYFGTKIRIYMNQNASYSKEFLSGQGFMTSQSPQLIFGLGEATKVDKAVISYPDGTTQIITNPSVDRVILLGNIKR